MQLQSTLPCTFTFTQFRLLFYTRERFSLMSVIPYSHLLYYWRGWLVISPSFPSLLVVTMYACMHAYGLSPLFLPPALLCPCPSSFLSNIQITNERRNREKFIMKKVGWCDSSEGKKERMPPVRIHTFLWINCIHACVISPEKESLLVIVKDICVNLTSDIKKITQLNLKN